MYLNKWIDNKRNQIIALLKDWSVPTPLSDDEKKVVSLLNDVSNTLVSYIVILSILSIAAPMIQRNILGGIVLAALIIVATISIDLKIFIQLLPTKVAGNALLYTMICLSILFLSLALDMLFT